MRLWRRADDIAVVESVDRVVVLPLTSVDSMAPVALEASALAVWRALDGEVSIEELLTRISDMIGVDPESIRSDVVEFVVQLEQMGIVVVYDGSDSVGADA